MASARCSLPIDIPRWRHRVVPIAVEGVAMQREGVDHLLGERDALGVCAGVAHCPHIEPGRGSGRADEVDHDLVTGERPATPVHRYRAPQAVPDCSIWSSQGGSGRR